MEEKIKQTIKEKLLKVYNKLRPDVFDFVLYVMLYGLLLTLIGLFFGWIPFSLWVTLKMIFGLGLVFYFIKEEFPQLILKCKSIRRRE